MATKTKPLHMPSPFTVVVDQREQLPYSFPLIRGDAKDAGQFIQVRMATGLLPSGDYSIEGHTDRIAVERKGGSDKGSEDLFATLGHGRDRFERELERLAAMLYAAVVVEATWESVLLDPPEHSRLMPKTVLRSVIAWQQRYPSVHWWFVPGRMFAELLTYRILDRYWKDVHGPRKDEA